MLGLLKDLRHKAVNRLADALLPTSSPSFVDDADDDGFEVVVENELDRVRRQRDEYFEVISRFERERDQLWKMYRIQVAEHLNAQALLSKERARLVLMLEKTVASLNGMRKEKGLEPMKGPSDLGIHPDSGDVAELAERYINRMIEVCKEASARLDEARPPFIAADEEIDRLGKPE